MKDKNSNKKDLKTIFYYCSGSGSGFGSGSGSGFGCGCVCGCGFGCGSGSGFGFGSGSVFRQRASCEDLLYFYTRARQAIY